MSGHVLTPDMQPTTHAYACQLVCHPLSLTPPPYTHIIIPLPLLLVPPSPLPHRMHTHHTYAGCQC